MIKKRKKVSRHRGSHTHSRGAKKKARGKGHRGGIGMSGSGKRADQKKSLVLKLYGNKYFGKQKALRRGPVTELQVINLRDISLNFNSFVKKKIISEEKGTVTANFSGYKILGIGDLSHKITIKASAASKSAIDKVKKAGGNLIVE